MEIGLGLAQFFPHKKRVYYFKNLNPYFMRLIKVLALEGYETQELTLQEMASPQKWMAQIHSKDLFVLYSLDDPFLGQLYPVEDLESQLSENQQIFRICVSHNQHKYTKIKKQQDNHKVTLYSIDSQSCLAHFGKRVHTKELISPSLNWNSWSDKNLDFGSMAQKKELVTGFEAALNKTPPLSHAQRIFDRAVLCWEDMDGFALIYQMAQDMDLPLGPPGADPHFETTSPSRWKSENFIKWLENLEFIQQVRGLVILSHKLIDSQFVDVVRSARKKVLERQSGKT